MNSGEHRAVVSIEGIDPLPLFGQADGNLRAIEDRFAVRLSSRNGELQVSGDDESGVSAAVHVLGILVDRARRGSPITGEDLEYLFSAADHGARPAAPKGVGVVVLGDKKVVKVRTLTQAE